MNGHVQLRFDTDRDVLYAKRADASIRRSAEAPSDGYLILNCDAEGRVVGVQLLAAQEMPNAAWRQHPDRGALPPDLLAALDDWMNGHR